MKYSISVLLTLSVFLVFSCDKPTDPVLTPSVKLESSEVTTTVGSIITIRAVATDLPSDFFAVSLRISFDSNRLTIGGDQSDWIGDVWSSSAIGLIEVESGIVYLSITQVAGAGNISGNGTILSLNLTTEQAGVASLDLVQSQLVFYDSNGGEVPMNDLEIEGASITIE